MLKHPRLTLHEPPWLTGVEILGGMMFGYSLIRLALFIVLAIVSSAAVGLFTYLMVSAFAE
ncbi:hypothetical protein FZO59_22090 [Lelliottia nimipressuralis]|uniref:Uncharacterized protein n=1 Tax=Lelliottia nimipressuralis TaxID=69220 RepID=A0ABD4K9C7_9ENTR|nr:hypothetical protein [Lelliottia nimipressuralis]MDH6632108.1 hypothetical protein [Lelliottia amnigena]PKA31434.1 hypothetical protein CWR41_16670 [Cedecea lapagei]MBF4178132.1 hypothetical protein [Lelliottia nimipressuralis]RXJ11556.1 hypothetical protein ETG88_17290 [Lelliottia nimipressuralis]TYT28092.1 hypothetical protein FZO59_22090 [Lelliottia nimipressuralis]